MLRRLLLQRWTPFFFKFRSCATLKRDLLLRNTSPNARCNIGTGSSMHSFNPSMQLRFFHQGRVAVEVHITTPPGRQYTGCYETRRQHQRQRNERWHDMFCITTTTATRRFSVEAKRDDLERSTSVGRILAPWLRQLWNGGDITASAKPSSIIRKSTATVGSSIGGWAAERRDNGESENTNNVERAISDESSDSKFAASDALEFDEHEEEEVHTIIKKGDPKTHWLVDPVLHPHIRACITDGTFESIELAQRDTGLSVCTLGTGAGNATKLRSNTCTVIKRNGDCYLIDAGEGLQRQFLLSRMNFRDVRKILITHLHGDHVFGLPGLLLNLQIAGINATKQRAVEIYGPVGLYNYIATALSLTGTELRRLVVEVYELHGGTQRSMRYAGNRKNFPEFHHRGLYRKMVPQNEDGTWTLAEPLEITTPDLAIKYCSTPRGMSIKAAEIHHVPQLQCFGYTFQEPRSKPRSIDAERANALGVTSPSSFRALKAGFPVMRDDGAGQVFPDEVCGEVPMSRKVTVLGDCCLIPPAMERLALNSDVLVHEATLSISDKGQKVEIGGHSTAAQAAIFANKVRAKVLLLNHLPKKVDLHKGVKECSIEAVSRIRGPTRVQVAFDHLEVLIPRRGFEYDESDFRKTAARENQISTEQESSTSVPDSERAEEILTKELVAS